MLAKRAPQGHYLALFDPFMYNIFSNDLMSLITGTGLGDIFNYADDNSTISADSVW
jgi:hypothetical protein